MLCIIAAQSFGLKPIWGPWKAQLHVPLPARSGLLVEVEDIGEQIRRINVEPMIPVAIRLFSWKVGNPTRIVTTLPPVL